MIDDFFIQCNEEGRCHGRLVAATGRCAAAIPVWVAFLENWPLRFVPAPDLPAKGLSIQSRRSNDFDVARPGMQTAIRL
jgi:hypothetical protein